MSANTCHALVLSGGGSNGAWEAGVIWGLLHYGNPDDFKWDVMSGVSAGSINSGFMSGFAVGDELRASEIMSDMWADLTTDEIYTHWSTGGYVRWLTSYPGFYDNAPMADFATKMVDQIFDNGIQRKFNMGSVNANTGEYHLFTEKNTPLENLGDAVISSASVPGAFPPHHYQGNYYMDGMTAWNTNLSSAITRCLEIVDDESKITIDIAICGANDLDVDDSTSHWALSNYWRAKDIRNANVGYNAIAAVKRSHPDVNYRYLFEQSKTLSGFNELTFENKTTWPYQEMGRQDALNALNEGEGISFTRFLYEKFNPFL